jgi:ornithine cyclodeaminase
MMDATTITAIRTAAVSGVATRLLARPDSKSLAILGTGVQGRSHLSAMIHARPIETVRIWSRNAEHAQQFAKREEERHGLSILVASSVAEAVSDADIICTTTSAREPILNGEWIPAGAHINAVGSSVPFARELDAAAVKKTRLYVDRRESILSEGGDFLLARKEGAVDDTHIIAEIGEVLLDETKGRRSSDEITLFKSLGLAVEDLAAAKHIYNKAVKEGVGVMVELGGERDDE